jgi:hypothetical protein
MQIVILDIPFHGKKPRILEEIAGSDCRCG